MDKFLYLDANRRITLYDHGVLHQEHRLGNHTFFWYDADDQDWTAEVIALATLACEVSNRLAALSTSELPL